MLGIEGVPVKKMSNVLCLVIFIALLPAVMMAQSPSNQAPASAGSQEIQLLKAQIKTVENYQDQFISIVQWSLSAVLAMALGLAAFNWYSSKVSYERDIQSLRQENKALHTELLALLKSETDVASKRLSEELSGRQANIEATVTKSLDAKLATQAAQLVNHKNQLLGLRYDITKREAEEAVNSKSYAWGIYKYCELLDLSVRKGSDFYQVGEILDAIGKILDNSATALSAENVSNAVETLRRLPQRYQAAAENLIPRI